MDFKNEKNVLINLYYKHGLSYELKYGQPNCGSYPKKQK